MPILVVITIAITAALVIPPVHTLISWASTLCLEH